MTNEKLIRSKDRGQFDYDWLKTRHTFSFGEYFNPNAMHFSTLRVINEDRVEPNEGFETHHHEDMEIITHVLSGQLEHRDSLGNGSIINAGDFQSMSAGSGVTHSEFNPSSNSIVHFLQIWIRPHEKGLKPQYHQITRPNLPNDGLFKIPIPLYQTAEIWKGIFHEPQVLTVPESLKNRPIWIHMISGTLEINTVTLESGDGFGCEFNIPPKLTAPSELIIFGL